MFVRIFVLTGLLATFGQQAFAQETKRDRANALVLQGNNLGRSGDFSGAIAKFKQADATFPRALTYCNIGLAYARLKRHHQAHYFLVKCRDLWETLESKPVNPWVDERIDETEGNLRAQSYARVVLHVQPTAATIGLSTYEINEPIPSGQTAWTPGGHVSVVVHLPDTSEKPALSN